MTKGSQSCSATVCMVHACIARTRGGDSGRVEDSWYFPRKATTAQEKSELSLGRAAGRIARA
ncbi:uncharacterized protein PITG_14045 [Phytophthora infestans T30-4]|uniref:Uncharacterized protein n=1 Tax=Phytophthora infestans (strain T30-4) TaxID=403677 RepID=D0NNI0_PHYIT|nr:uncharacterized protein PITG_14045 [Phytophthora infestans T30-4]EEY62151.1 hypothetical protein PITG_14045 [Phytophthora infestans T30-4]|eukprot:XP_002899182.1 hypothetical protein PITG_14045 [Phytophthora infestans T30-4]